MTQNTLPGPALLQRFLRGVHYPASRDDLVQSARDLNADPAVIDVLTVIPDDQYDSPDAVVIEIIEVDDD